MIDLFDNSFAPLAIPANSSTTFRNYLYFIWIFLYFCILVKLENYEAAASSFEAALETAKLQGDEDAEVAICKALDDVKTK